MRLLFLSMDSIYNIDVHGIYTDLMRKFWKEGYDVYIVTPRERRTGQKTSLTEGVRLHLLGVKTLNLQKTNVIEKGLGQVLVEYQFKNAIRHYFKHINFDLILYSTPPITVSQVVRYLRNCNPTAKTYLLLKDIFPQNAVDIGMLSNSGIKGILYRYFRKKEKKLYAFSDFIGCMSPANVRYILEHNEEILQGKVEIAPNSYECTTSAILSNEKNNSIRDKYSLPKDKPIFIYGGNLGKPQGIPFLIECLMANSNRGDCHFLIIGDGTEYNLMDCWYREKRPKNVSLFQRLPKEDYDQLVRSCDVGMIFLDYRFTIPNYPSRLLPYLMEKKPIIAATDRISDVGAIAEANGYGFWCPSNDVNAFTKCLDKMMTANMSIMGELGYQYYLSHYTVEHTYKAIISH